MESKSDPSLFVSHQKDVLIILAIHVDDGLVVADNIQSIDAVIKHLQDHFEVNAMDFGCFLGVQIENRNGSIFIHQAAYTQQNLS